MLVIFNFPSLICHQLARHDRGNRFMFVKSLRNVRPPAGGGDGKKKKKKKKTIVCLLQWHLVEMGSAEPGRKTLSYQSTLTSGMEVVKSISPVLLDSYIFKYQ